MDISPGNLTMVNSIYILIFWISWESQLSICGKNGYIPSGKLTVNPWWMVKNL